MITAIRCEQHPARRDSGQAPPCGVPRHGLTEASNLKAELTGLLTPIAEALTWAEPRPGCRDERRMRPSPASWVAAMVMAVNPAAVSSCWYWVRVKAAAQAPPMAHSVAARCAIHSQGRARYEDDSDDTETVQLVLTNSDE
jgi:hypothetical protein